MGVPKKSESERAAAKTMAPRAGDAAQSARRVSMSPTGGGSSLLAEDTTDRPHRTVKWTILCDPEIRHRLKIATAFKDQTIAETFEQMALMWLESNEKWR